ncbi:hypothetical protein FEE95_19250 [Maribacter algarum]|uniref:Uncharacterized protein n=1 Tax=Maribacter algarum (ex Zhang et al. 2020) TaxID=2578118 RepID=A0A5S3PGG4_9FLAO|nr:hypothetical protein [Maribacter algarum]TMM53206.1 hypothetical protein FEE95_19250 [Maribacter algarum]
MANLTAEQVKRLADNFMLMANALGDYRYNNIDSLTDEENIKIKGIHNQQLAQTTELYTKSAILVLEDAQDALKKIDKITAESQELYKKLTNVQSILDRASSVLNLASAILALDVSAVTRSIQELVS